MKNELIPVARLFGRLFLHEVEASLLAELQQPELASALEELGIDIPAGADSSAIIEQLSVEYCSQFVVAPNQVPLVQSIWEHGSYEGKSVAALRELAQAADLDFERESARNAPIDHLGCILLLWAELAEEDWPEAIAYVAQHHLQWPKSPLETLASREGFYAQLAAATTELARIIHRRFEA